MVRDHGSATQASKLGRPKRLAPRQRALLAKRIRAVYIFERNTWEYARSSKSIPDYQPGPKWDGYGGRKSVWPTLADFVSQHDISAHPYLYLVFWHPDFIQRPPLPSDLFSTKWQRRFQHHANSHPRQLVLLGKCAQRGLSSNALCQAELLSMSYPELDQARIERSAIENALLDNESEVSAYYRVFAAYKSGMMEIVEALKTDAAVAYSRAKESYDIAWPHVPHELRQELLRHMDDILGLNTQKRQRSAARAK